VVLGEVGERVLIRRPDPPDVTPDQVREARALLKWSVADLSKCSIVSERVIEHFESSHPGPTAGHAVKAIRIALEKEGIAFTGNGIPSVELGPRPPGPRRRKPARPNSPQRQVYAKSRHGDE
jgi:hypothetical protein